MTYDAGDRPDGRERAGRAAAADAIAAAERRAVRHACRRRTSCFTSTRRRWRPRRLAAGDTITTPTATTYDVLFVERQTLETTRPLRGVTRLAERDALTA